MTPWLGLLLLALAGQADCDPPGFLTPWVGDGQTGRPAGASAAYAPQPGDLVFYYDHTLFWRTLFWMAGTEAPDHVGIMVRLPDQSLALLEAGPDNRPRVELLEVPAHLHYYRGTVWVRRLRRPLTPAQATALTNYAIIQQGKPYALVRIALAVTPFSPRGPIKSRLFGKAHGDRTSWFCSELVAEAAIHIGLVSPQKIWPNVTYPHDLFVDQETDVSGVWEKPCVWSPQPLPAELAPRPTARPMTEAVAPGRSTPR